MKDDTKKLTESQRIEGGDTATSTVIRTIERSDAETSTETQEATSTDAGFKLTPLEEKVIRMRYGKSLKGQEALEFAAGASLETRLKLALIESHLLEAFQADALDPDPKTGNPRTVLADAMD